MKTRFLILGVLCLSQLAAGQVLRDQRDRSLLKDPRPKGEKVLVNTVLKSKSSRKSEYEKSLEKWDMLLEAHVGKKGRGVSYQGFAKDSAILDTFISSHDRLKLDELDDDVLTAIYINLYSAGMIYNILKYAKAKKIDIASDSFLNLNINSLDISEDIWSNENYCLPLSGRKITLNGIEHGLMRRQLSPGRGGYPKELAAYAIKKLDPRIHAAINCGAASCPSIREIAYRPENLRAMLQENMINFLNDPTQFSKINDSKLKANKIIFWYYSDFDDFAKKQKNLRGAGDYFASFVNASNPNGEWMRKHFKENYNDRNFFALRFTSAFNWHYDWKINDKRNF